MSSLVVIGVAGAAIGVLYGMFGVGSAFATPVLSLLGIPGIAAVSAPLPGLLPGSAAGAWARRDKVDWTVARRTVAGGAPAAISGAIASHWVGGPALLVLSGVILLVVGIRVLRPGRGLADPAAAQRRRDSATFVVVAAAGVGFSSGLLANGGGFLLVPLFLLALGLDMNEAASTSMVAATAFTLPTLITHGALGNIDWLIAGTFAVGLIPGSYGGARLAQRLPVDRMRVSFGVILVAFAIWFLARQAL